MPSTVGPLHGRTPKPPADLNITTISWPPLKTEIHRVHADRYAGDAFNDRGLGNARFSPIRDATGKIIPTMYGGTTFECAAMETVFHDVSFEAGLKNYDKAKLKGHLHSQIAVKKPLKLADLRNKALRLLGVKRNQLIDTEKDQYPTTREWAVAIHTQCPDVQGLCWVSRQDDSAQAVLLFGDRIDTGAVTIATPSRSLIGDPVAYRELLVLAEQIGLNIVPSVS
jgi:hypothetical protein